LTISDASGDECEGVFEVGAGRKWLRSAELCFLEN
jgi:hypothetical protein